MELQEDAYRLREVLQNVSPKEVIKFLRTKVPLADTEIRCQLALQHFLNLEDSSAKKEETYESDIKADFLCIRHLLKSVSDEEIKDILNILGSIPNRKYVAVKLLLRECPQSLFGKKRKTYDTQGDIGEASSSKLVKVTESNEACESNVNGIENLELPDETDKRKPLKLRIKSVKDRNGNDKFVVTSPSKTRSEPEDFQSTPQEISTTTPEVIKIPDEENKIVMLSSISSVKKTLNTPLCESTTGDQYNGLPSTSSTFQNRARPTILSNTIFFPKQASHNLYESGPSTSIIQPSTFTFNEDTVPSTSDIQPSIFKFSENTTSKSIATDKINDPVEHVDESNEIDVSGEYSSSNENFEEGLDLSQGPKFIDEKLVLKLMEMFQDASPDFIRKVCEGKEWSEQNFDEILTVILSTDSYPKRPERQPSPPKEVDPEEQFIMLKQLLPEADPSYLHEKLDQFAGDQDALSDFIEDAIQNKKYPTLKEYLRKQQLSAQQRQYTTEFNVERFVELFPDPVSTFEDPNRKTTILDHSDKCYVKWFMRNKFNQLYAKDVNNIVDSEGNKNIVSVVKALNCVLAKGNLKKTRWVSQSRPDTQNIPLLQELAYFEHIDAIYDHIENKKKQAEQERQNAKELGLLQTCSCCYDENVMPFDILTCAGGCRFCRDCIKKGTEVAFSEGKVTFPCLMDCGAEFALQVLQNVLPPKVFSKLAQKKAVAEVKAAGIEDLETCPFCDFATIPAQEDRLFRCLNPDCMKESCRLCKEPSHVPYRCDEVEKDEAVKARTYIEDKMTEALIRQCWKCNAKFIKEEGCNKMTCSCGAIMCYVCRKPVKDYRHFNGQGGDRHDLCPLYTDNFSVNENNVLKAAAEAKKEVDPTQLKNDPTADLQKHFGDKIKEAKKRAEQHGGALRHGPILQQQQYRQVQRLRDELREQLRLVRDLNRPDQQEVVDQLGPQLNQLFVQQVHQAPRAHQPPPVQIQRVDVGQPGNANQHPNQEIDELENPHAARMLIVQHGHVHRAYRRPPRYAPPRPPNQAPHQHQADIHNG